MVGWNRASCVRWERRKLVLDSFRIHRNQPNDQRLLFLGEFSSNWKPALIPLALRSRSEHAHAQIARREPSEINESPRSSVAKVRSNASSLSDHDHVFVITRYFAKATLILVEVKFSNRDKHVSKRWINGKWVIR